MQPPAEPAPSSESPAPSSEKPTPTVEPQPEAPKQDQKQAEPEQDEKQARPDLRISVKFDRAEYGQGEPLGITVAVTNVGTAPADQVRFATEPFQMFLTTGVDELVSRPRLVPGETKTIKLGGTSHWSGFPGQKAGLEVRTYAEGATDPTPNDNVSRAETSIVTNSGKVTGVLFEDRDGNGVPGPGEYHGNTSIKLVGGPNYPLSPRYVSGDGRFSMDFVLAGTYQARFVTGYSYDRMLKPGQFIVVKKGETTEVALQVVPSLSRSLVIAGHTFDKPRYAKGDDIKVSVTLRNTGTAPITGLVAVCDQENDPATLDGTGPGWAEVNPDAPGSGVTIPAGGQKTITVSDVVPDVDYPTGKVYFACVFSVDGRNSEGGSMGNPGLTAGADVAGTLGGVAGRVLSNGSPIPSDVKIVAFSPVTNRIVGHAQSINGNWRIDNLPRGPVALKVVGTWQFADGSPQRLVDIVAERNVTADLDLKSGPQVKDPTVFAPDLKASVTFDKETYDISDPVRMTIKVENIGTGINPARGSFNGTPYVEETPSFDYLALRDFTQAPIVLWPGESKQITVTGQARDGGDDHEKLRKLRYLVDVGSQNSDPNPANNKAEATANVTWATGSATVTVYGDRNLNGQMDAGEELANRIVGLGGGKPHLNSADGKTDAAGKVRFTNLPAGTHRTYDRYDRETGWIPAEGSGQKEIVVNPGDEGTALIRMVRPISDELKASITFDQPSYQRGDRVGLTVSITNNTANTLQVKAFCGGAFGPYLGNEGAEWGPFTDKGPGVQVAAGGKVDVHVDTALPAESPDHGYVVVSCAFGPDNTAGIPFARAMAKVPGVTNTFRGRVVSGDPTRVNPDAKPVVGVKLVLLDPETNKPVARTTTDAEGNWVFPDLAVGLYTPVVVGPWRILDTWSEGQPFGNVRGYEYPEWIWVQPGQDVADPDLTAPPGDGGSGGGSNSGLLPVKNTDALANTGVSVLGLLLFGALLVMAGASLVGRRRTA